MFEKVQKHPKPLLHVFSTEMHKKTGIKKDIQFVFYNDISYVTSGQESVQYLVYIETFDTYNL